jgi:hypothetical protein
VPPVPCPDIDSPVSCNPGHILDGIPRKYPLLWRNPFRDLCDEQYNPNMSPQRWLYFFLAILTGLAIGLFYGRVISPVEYVDTTLDTLGPDYRADFVLMTAEIYQSDQDIATAARQLALLGSQPPVETATQALNFARQNGYHASDIALLENLIATLQVWQPDGIAPSLHNTTPVVQPGGGLP